jgi:hypothetical protein
VVVVVVSSLMMVQHSRVLSVAVVVVQRGVKPLLLQAQSIRGMRQGQAQ